MTIQELAKIAGVSPSTISRVFSHHPNIRTEVRERIFALSKQYDYHPRLSTKQRNVVLVTPYNATSPVQCCVEMLLLALTNELPQHGFRLEILPQDNLERLDTISFCAAVAIGAEPIRFKGWTQRFPTPLVIVDRKATFSEPDIFTVRSDEAQGVELAIDQLYSHGHRRIGCVIHGGPKTGNAALRHAAIMTELKKRELPCSEAFIHYAGDGDYVDIIGNLLRLDIDALFCPGGNGGIIASYALSLFSKRIPKEISLIASEQIFYSKYASPPQTTITQDYQAVAFTVAETISKRLDGKPVRSDTVLPYQLIVRGSVADNQ